MGIDGLHRYFQKFTGGKYSTSNKNTYDIVAVDVNNYLHVVFRRQNSKTVENVARGFVTALRKILEYSKIKKQLILAIDGSAPVAKVQLQIQRRQRKQANLELTVGTNFMNDFSAHLQERCSEYFSEFFAHDATNPEIIFANSNTIGEGEYKIFDHLYKRYADESIPKGETLLVISNDSDLYLYLLYFHHKFIHLNLQIHFKQDEKSLVNFRHFYGNIIAKRGVLSVEQFLDDLCVMIICSGCDFTPKLKTFRLLRTMDTYFRYRSNRNNHERIVELNEKEMIVNVEFFAMKIAGGDRIHYPEIIPSNSTAKPTTSVQPTKEDTQKEEKDAEEEIDEEEEEEEEEEEIILQPIQKELTLEEKTAAIKHFFSSVLYSLQYFKAKVLNYSHFAFQSVSMAMLLSVVPHQKQLIIPFDMNKESVPMQPTLMGLCLIPWTHHSVHLGLQIEELEAFRNHDSVKPVLQSSNLALSVATNESILKQIFAQVITEEKHTNFSDIVHIPIVPKNLKRKRQEVVEDETEEAYYCRTCNMRMGLPKQFNEHLASKQHRKRVEGYERKLQKKQQRHAEEAAVVTNLLSNKRSQNTSTTADDSEPRRKLTNKLNFSRVQSAFHTWIDDQTKSNGFTCEDWVRKLKLDGFKITFKVDLDFTEEFQECSILIPTSYPTGTYTVQTPLGTKQQTGKNLAYILDTVFHEFEEERESVMNELNTPSAVDDKSAHQFEGFDEEMHESHEIYIEDETVDDERVKVREMIEHDFAKVRRRDGWFAEIGTCSVDQIRIYLLLDPKKRLEISELVAQAWGIHLDKYITLALTFSSFYLDSTDLPQLDVYQSGFLLNPKVNKIDHKLKFGLYWTVENRLREDFLKKFWPIEKYAAEGNKTGLNYMEALLQYTETIIKTSPSKCIICGGKMLFEGLKPTVCEKQLCIFSHEEYGLGVDLESAIKNTSDLVDLLVTMSLAATAAVNNRYNPFNPFPEGLEVKRRDKEGKIVSHSFMQNGERDMNKVRQLLELLPAVSKLKDWVEHGKLKDELDKLHPLLYTLLRWIMASNRSHLKKLENHEQIKDMGTPYQYILMSGSPEKEKQFQTLKKQYGSVYAFHGSALCNWHSILRIGLKNMSGTSGQLNGAAYGSGVYLAQHSNTSIGYLRFQSGWKNSMFSSHNLGMMAMCEIIKAPELKGQPNPYYVIANEAYIQTRYFFLFTNSSSCNVDGSVVKPPKIKWE